MKEARELNITRAGVHQESINNLSKYDLDGDGKISPYELAKAGHLYGWERNHKVWVMGNICESILKKINDETTAAEEEAKEAAPTHEAYRHLYERSRTGCKAPCWLNGGGRCECKMYDPQLLLPLSLMNKLEVALDVETAARSLLEQADAFLFGNTDSEDPIKASDFQVNVEEINKPERDGRSKTTTGFRPGSAGPGAMRASMFGAAAAAEKDMFATAPEGSTPASAFNGMPAHLICYKMRSHKRGGNQTRQERSANNVLDKIEAEVNDKLLPHLLRFCEEYRAVKVGQMKEARKEEEAKKRGGGPKEILPKMATATEWMVFKPAFFVNREAKPDNRPPELIVEQPRVSCRCGHADLWHQRMEPSGPQETAEEAAKASQEGDGNLVREGLGARRQRSAPHLTGNGEARLARGRLHLPSDKRRARALKQAGATVVR
mmetsp:Transcript_100197/g.188831  ORF Transcript_100197/g.188831 Transcript_100197/m.188831 type:complete len:435 (+) Transcript_100197:99-1403(+)